MIPFEKNNIDSYKLFTLPLTKKLITSECPFLETVQLLFETFFNTIKNKRDFRNNEISWFSLYILYEIKIYV